MKRSYHSHSFISCDYVLIEKIEMLVVKDISPLNFAKNLSFSEVQKKIHVVNIWSRSQQVGSLF